MQPPRWSPNKPASTSRTLVFTQGLDKQPLSVALAFFIDETGIQWGDLMAASLLMSMPAIIVFTLSQKLLVRGLSEGAVKG